MLKLQILESNEEGPFSLRFRATLTLRSSLASFLDSLPPPTWTPTFYRFSESIFIFCFLPVYHLTGEEQSCSRICHSSASEYITWIALEDILKIFPGTQISMDRRHLDLNFVYDECNSRKELLEVMFYIFIVVGVKRVQRPQILFVV